MMPRPKKVIKYYTYNEGKSTGAEEIPYVEPTDMSNATSVCQDDESIEVTFNHKERIEYVMHDRPEATTTAKYLARKMIDDIRSSQMPSEQQNPN